MPEFEEYVEEIKDLWDSRWLSNRGAKHKRLETELASIFDSKNVALFANGHVALEVAIDAFNFPKGGEVITTPFTHCSTTHSIFRNDLVPVFCDIDEHDFTIDAGQIEKYITDKTVAIIPTHVYGNICAVEEIEQIAKKHGLKVIYDAAHAIGVKYKGQSIARFGDASMYSMHATKVLNAIEGGVTIFNDDEIFGKIDHMTNFGYVNPENVEYISTNARMNEFEAAMALCNLRHLDSEIAKRKDVFNQYSERLSHIDGIQILGAQDDVVPNYSYFPIFLEGYGKSRDEVQEQLQKENILARKYFYPIIPEMNAYKAKYPNNNTPIAKRKSEAVLSLPMYSDLRPEEVDLICDIIIS